MATVTLYPTDDAYVDEDRPTTNYGSKTYLIIRDRKDHAAFFFMKFDLSGLTGKEILSAKLRIYYYFYDDTNPAGKTVKIYLVSGDWDEGTITYNNKPYVDTSVSTSFNMPSSYGWIEVDVTNFVRKWVSGAKPNYGFRLHITATQTTYYSEIYFYSSEASGNKPELVVEYKQEVTLSVSTAVSTALSKIASISRTLSISSIPSTSITAKSVIKRKLSISTTASTGLSRVLTAVRTLAASTTASTSLKRIVALYRQLSASTTASASISWKVVITRQLTASISASASASIKATYKRTVTIPITVSPLLTVRTKEEVCGLPDFITSTNIRMQTLGRLRVDIAAQSIGNIDVNLASSSITLDVNVTNSTLDVNVTNSTLDVNVTNSELNVNVTNSTLDVNITNTEVGVNITASSVTLDINAQGGTIDNVNYADAIIKSNCFEGALARGDYGGNKYTFAHTPSGYVFYLVGATLSVYNSDTSSEKEGWLGVYNPCVGSEQIIADVVVPPGGAQSVDVSLATPVKIPYGGYFFLQAHTNAYPVAAVRLVLVSASLDIKSLGDLMEKGKLITMTWPPVKGVNDDEFPDKHQHRLERALQETTAKM